MKACINPGKIHDWSILIEDMTVASSNYGEYDTESETRDAFEAICEAAKNDEIPHEIVEYNYRFEIHCDDVDLYFLGDYATIDAAEAMFQEVVKFLREY